MTEIEQLKEEIKLLREAINALQPYQIQYVPIWQYIPPYYPYLSWQSGSLSGQHTAYTNRGIVSINAMGRQT